MPTLEDIHLQIKKLDSTSRFLARREIKELPNILHSDEVLEAIIQGAYQKNMGLLVASNKRLIFIDKGLLGGLTVEDFPYDKISSIQYKTGFLFGEITIYSSGNNALIEQVDKKQCRIFAEFIRAKMTNPISKTPPPQTKESIADELEKLARLKNAGILTEEEFTQQKMKLLNA